MLEYVGTCLRSIFVFFTGLSGSFEFVCVRDSDSYFYHCKVILCTLESLVSVTVIVIILMIIEYDFLFVSITSFSTNWPTKFSIF